MPDEIPFPRLTSANSETTSDRDVRYHCIAWAAKDTERWWEPGLFWPVEITGEPDYGIASLETAFQSLGYLECSDDTLESGFEKVALYGSGFLYTHAARQLPNGNWTSKLGKSEDIRHDTPDDIAGGIYGEVVEFMRRPIADT